MRPGSQCDADYADGSVPLQLSPSRSQGMKRCAMVRVGLDAVRALHRAGQQLSGFLLRQGCHYGRPAWTKPHTTVGSRVRCLNRRCIISRSRITLRRSKLPRRGARLTAQIAAMLPDWTPAPVVAALQTMRRLALVNAATLIGELGDLVRFANPRQLVAYLGLVPSEHLCGASVKRGGLTEAGKSPARRLLMRAAGATASHSGQPRVAAPGGGAVLVDPGDRPEREATVARYSKLAHSGKPANVVTAAIARELAGFIWAIARRVRRRRADPKRPVIASQGGASEPPNTLLLGNREARLRSGEPS